jgi:hypothetical protein
VSREGYTECDGKRCRHELAGGVTLAELRSGDGPYPTARFTALATTREPWRTPAGAAA